MIKATGPLEYPNNNYSTAVYSKLSVNAFLKVLIDFMIVPVMAWIPCLYAAFDWTDRPSYVVSHSLRAGAILLAIVAAMAYQTGYKGFYRSGRKNYFFVVFITPMLVGTAGLVTGMMLSLR